MDNPQRNDPVFKTLSRVFRYGGAYNLSRNKKIRFAVRNLARKRFILGYPPRKQNDTSIGDAVNWEWIIECAKSSGKDIIIVSRDSDYGCNYDGRFHLNDWLRSEFKERISQKRRVVLTDRLAAAFKLVAVSVSTEAEAEEKTILAERATRTVNCGQCGSVFDEPSSLDPSLRIACPKWGQRLDA